MKITAENTHSYTLTEGDTPARNVASNAEDAAWFSAAVQPPVKTAGSGEQPWIGKIASLSEMANKDAQQADRVLIKASRSNDPQTVLDASRTLSSYYLENLLNAKLVSKGVQSLEKLTNLQ